MAHHTFEVTEDRISQLENKTFEIIEDKIKSCKIKELINQPKSYCSSHYRYILSVFELTKDPNKCGKADKKSEIMILLSITKECMCGSLK